MSVWKRGDLEARIFANQGNKRGRCLKMPPEATLRDTLVSEATTEEKPIEKAEEKPAAAAVNLDAAEIGQILLDSGFTKDQLNALMEAPKALAAIRNQIENDPTEFVT